MRQSTVPCHGASVRRLTASARVTVGRGAIDRGAIDGRAGVDRRGALRHPWVALGLDAAVVARVAHVAPTAVGIAVTTLRIQRC